MGDHLFEINCYSYKRCPGLYCEILKCTADNLECMDLSEGVSDEMNHMIYIITGTADAVINNNTYEAVENDLIFVAPGERYELHATSENVRCLYIAYHIYLPQNSGYDEEDNVLTNSYTRCKMRIHEVTHITKFGAVYLLLQQIIQEVELQQKMYISVVKGLLLQMIVGVFRMEGILPSPIEHINSIALWSGPEGEFEIPADTDLRISDFEFWSGTDSADDPEKLFGIICTQRFYIESERSIDKVVCWSDEELRLQGKALQAVQAREKTNFKVWFFLERGIKDLNLRPYINTGYIRFFLRSNRSFRCVFSMYHRATYSCISSIIDIVGGDGLQEIRIPFFSENGKITASDYIESVLAYVRENYKNKITLDALCDHVHLQKAYLCTVFKNHMQMSIGEYIRLYRVNIAKNLLLETKYNTEEIAQSVGFYDIHHFSRVFKQIVGINPSDFRKNNRVQRK